MFKANISTENFKEVIEALTALVKEAKFNIMPAGISVKAVDPANVAMVCVDISDDAFTSFDATEGVLGIDLVKLDSILGIAEKDDNIELELDENAHKLIIRMRGLSYNMLLLDPESIKKEPKVPELELPAQVVIKGEDLKRGVKAAEKVSDYMYLSVKDSTFYMQAEGDTDSVVVDVPSDELIDISPAEAKSLFALEYISDIGKVAGKANEVTINLGTDYPMKMTLKIAEGHGEVTYMLAPRVESD